MNIKDEVLVFLTDEVCSKYGLYRQSIDTFFNTSVSNENKKTQAKTIIENLLYQHSKDDLAKAINDLATIETSVRNIDISDIDIRDHVVHALYTYCLGIYLIEHLNLDISPFEWKLSSLLHDIGYPLDVSMKLTKQIERYSNIYEAELQQMQKQVVFGLRLTNFSKLTINRSAVQLITSRFRRWGFQFSAGKLLQEIERTGKINHGVISGIFILRMIERLYKRNNPNIISGQRHDVDGRDWNYDTFYEDIVDIASSVMIHSLSIDNFRDIPIDVNHHPLPFLLRFTDELQDWDRLGRNEVFNKPSEYSIDFDGTRRIIIGLPADQRDHLQRNFQCFHGVTLEFV